MSGQAVTFTATVTVTGGAAGTSGASGSPTGTVSFMDGKSLLGTAPVGAGGAASFTTTGLSVGGHTITAVYGGDANFAASTSAPLAQTVAPKLATLGGRVWLDGCGTGLSAYNTPMPGVTVYLYQDKNANGVLDAADGPPVATQVSGADGTYAFANLSAGRFLVKEAVPANYVRTAPSLSDSYASNTAGGASAANLDFANFHKLNKADVKNVYFTDRGQTFTDLRGHVREGDTVTVTFTVTAGHTDELSLVSYTAPDSYFNAADASRQAVYQVAQGTYSAGTYCLTVKVPPSDFQVDFVLGCVIYHFGPDGSNLFYSAQDRLFSADNG